MKKSRDDFSEAVKRTVAERVNRRCSRCGAQTSGPQRDTAKSLNVGVASHITAAALGGPRYDKSLTTEQRKGPDNAVWLCQTCGKLVDNDDSLFTVEGLRRWKLAAEAQALASIGMPAVAQSPGTLPLSPAEIELLIAAETARGEISVIDLGEEPRWVRAGRHHFRDPSDRAVAAIHLEALRGLVSRRLAEHAGGVLYELTGTGFMRARELRQLRDDMGSDSESRRLTKLQLRLLELVDKGKDSFGPEDFHPDWPDGEGLKRFQVEANELAGLQEAGYINRLMVTKDSFEGRLYIDRVLIIEGLTAPGFRALRKS